VFSARLKPRPFKTKYRNSEFWLVGFGVGDVDDGDLRGVALGGDRNQDVVFVLFAGGENGSVAGLDDRGLIAELFLVEGDDLV